jgi:prepilin-type N-terminal cleavage/methylation domain-containing protein
MAQKYTILKVIIQNFSKINKTSKGFTLIELIVGLSIMLIIGGLAMNALIQASTSFNKDKRSIDSSQNLSAILEIIGSDIRQSGENINDSNFPVIEFVTNTDSGSMANSSKIIVRRALTSRLTLCDSTFTPTATSIIVADNRPSTVTASPNCDVGTSSNPLSVYRVATTVTAPATPTTVPVTTVPVITSYYPQAAGIFNPYPTAPAPLALKLPLALRKVRDYRCNTDPNINYDSAANAGADFCSLVPPLAQTRIAVSSSDGQLLIFNQTGEVVEAASDTTVNPEATVLPPTSTKRYSIAVNRNFALGNATAVPPIPADTAIANNAKNSAGTINYNIGDPIYVIDERVYTLASNGSFSVSVNGAPPEILIKKIANFRVSAKTYTNSTDRIVQPNPAAADVCADALPFAAQPTTGSESSPKYICKFNYFDTVGLADRANWKTLAGIKVEIQTKYDRTGQDAEATNPLLDSAQVKESKTKLYAVSEFFPRNVLSK